MKQQGTADLTMPPISEFVQHDQIVAQQRQRKPAGLAVAVLLLQRIYRQSHVQSDEEFKLQRLEIDPDPDRLS